jgi:DNA-binding NarL/FixJ family response regulator
MSIRVLIADDQQLVRTGFAMILSTDSEIEVVAEATNGHEAVKLATSLAPDVVLMDIQMPVLNGIEATRRILGDARTAATRVLILTTFDLDEYVYDALRAGATGFLLKDTPPEQLLTAVRTAHHGDALLAPSVTRRLIEEFTQARQPAPAAAAQLEQLSPREAEVFSLLARGLTNREIAAQLVVGENTVKTHVARTLNKLSLRDRVQAVVLAYEAGIVTPGDAGTESGEPPRSDALRR